MVALILDYGMIRSSNDYVGIRLFIHLDELAELRREHLTGGFLGIAVDTAVAVPIKPLEACAVELIYSAVDPAIEELVLYGIGYLLYPALRLRIVSLAE